LGDLAGRLGYLASVEFGRPSDEFGRPSGEFGRPSSGEFGRPILET